MTEADGGNIPFISTEQMRDVDRAMVDDYGILLIQMMENAGRNLAELAGARFLAGDAAGKSVLVLAGTGGNGGGGLVCARRLHSWGANVRTWTTQPAAGYRDIPAHQLSVLERMGAELNVADDSAVELPGADLVIDAIIGYSLSGAPRGPAAALIRAANGHEAPVLALDAPSGVDTATGQTHEPSIEATATMTLALPKQGLKSARGSVGELYLADIGVPPELYAQPALGLKIGAIFSKGEIIRLW